MLTCLQLKKYFGGVKAVDNCGFEVKTGTITALIGPNGSGKSTVFNLVSGILRADSGKIIFDGNDITGKSPEDISNSGISRLFQQSRLFNNLTVEENLFLAPDNEDTKFWKNFLGKWIVKEKSAFAKASADKKKKIEEALELINMESFKNKITRDLSYGQKRLVELARTILNPHKFLMLDEPVAGITPKLREEIGKLLLKLKTEGETILLIEHDMDFTLKIADRVVVMNEGKILTQGKPEEIRNNPRVLEAYLGE